jgi:hypothetical protein
LKRWEGMRRERKSFRRGELIFGDAFSKRESLIP